MAACTVANPSRTPFGSPHGRFFKETLRDHRKGHTAGDVLWLGPSNLHKENFDGEGTADFMLRVENAAAARLVRRIFRQDAHRRIPSSNHHIELNDSNHLLLDGGIPFSSYILRSIHQLVGDMTTEGEPALFTSQFYPTWKIARAFRDHPSSIAAFNRSTALDRDGMGLASRLQQFVEWLGPDIPDGAETELYVHAKSFSAEVKPNPKRRLFPEYEGRIGVLGTDNMNRLGVLAGTQELVVATTDSSLLEQHARWVKEKFG